MTENEQKIFLDLSGKGLAKMAVTGIAAQGINKATLSFMKTFGYANDMVGKGLPAPKLATRVQIGIASMYVSRIVIDKVETLINDDLDKFADFYVEARDAFRNAEPKKAEEFIE